MKFFPWMLYAFSGVLMWALAFTLGFALDFERFSFGDILMLVVSVAIPVATSVASADYLLKWKLRKLPYDGVYVSGLPAAIITVFSIFGIVGTVYVSRNILLPATGGNLRFLLVAEVSAILLIAVIAVIHWFLIWLDRIGRIKSSG